MTSIWRNIKGQIAPEVMAIALGFALIMWAGDGIAKGAKKVGCKLHLSKCPIVKVENPTA